MTRISVHARPCPCCGQDCAATAQDVYGRFVTTCGNEACRAYRVRFGNYVAAIMSVLAEHAREPR